MYVGSQASAQRLQCCLWWELLHFGIYDILLFIVAPSARAFGIQPIEAVHVPYADIEADKVHIRLKGVDMKIKDPSKYKTHERRLILSVKDRIEMEGEL